MQNLLQGVVDLGAPAQSLGERLSANRHDHEFLEVDVVVSMHAAVEDVHHGSGQQMSVRTANILVERQSCFLGSCTSGCQRDAQDGVGAEASLVVSAVEGDHGIVDCALVVGLVAHELIGKLGVHMLDRSLDALAHVAVLVAIAQLDSLERTGRRAGRNHRTPHGAAFKGDFHLDGGVAAGVENFAAVHIDNHAHVVPPWGDWLLSVSMIALVTYASTMLRWKSKHTGQRLFTVTDCRTGDVLR